jgi:hypothetical protein
MKTISFTELQRRPPLHHSGFTPSGPPKALTPVDRAFKQAFRDLLDLKVRRDDWKFSVRPSALPICPWKVMLAELLGDDGPSEVMSFAREFYFEVGNTVHRVVQKWLGRSGILFGPYECRRCRNIEVTLGEPKKCPTGCERPDWLYREINLKEADPSGIFASAHADGLIHFSWQEDGHYYLADFKTCSLNSLPSPEYGLVRDYHQKYLMQTGVYVHLLNRSEDMHVDGTALIFIPRDDPKKMTAIVSDQSDTNGEIYHGVVAEVRAAKAAAKTGDASNVRRMCASKDDDKECLFHKVCFDRQATKQLFVDRLKNLPVLPSF